MRRRLLIPLLLACFLGGCGTFTDAFGSKKPHPDARITSSKVRGGKFRVYGGIRYDLQILAEGKAGWLLALYAVDLPFSLALDTLLLPVTVTYNLAK